jgi:hypothetical protein
VRVRSLDGTITLPAMLIDYSFEGNGTPYDFVRLTQIPSVVGNIDFSVQINPLVGNPTQYYHLLSYESDSGFVMHTLNNLPNQVWLDTIATPGNNARLWNIVFVQTFLSPPNSQFIRGWCVPYRVPQ